MQVRKPTPETFSYRFPAQWTVFLKSDACREDIILPAPVCVSAKHTTSLPLSLPTFVGALRVVPSSQRGTPDGEARENKPCHTTVLAVQ